MVASILIWLTSVSGLLCIDSRIPHFLLTISLQSPDKIRKVRHLSMTWWERSSVATENLVGDS